MRLSRPSSSSPATDWIIETSSASFASIGGSRPGSRAASIDLPAPGGPIIRRLCAPAAAISRARLALSWPLMSARSSGVSGAGASFASGAGSTLEPLKWLISAISEGAARISISPAQAASPPCEPGQIRPFSSALAAIAAGSTPATGESVPSSANSPSVT